MPKFAPEQTQSRQAIPADTQRQYQTEVVARPVNIAVTPAESNLARLTNALGSFMPTANKYLDKKIEEDGHEQEALGFKSSKEGQPMPATASPWFQQGFAKANWESHAIDASEEAYKEYQTKKDDPTFDLKGFLSQKIQTDLNGITDPTAIKTYMDRFGAMGAGLQHDFTQHQIDQTMVQRKQDINVGVTDLVKRMADPRNPQRFAKPEDFLTAFDGLTGQAKGMSITQPEMTATLLDAVTAQSKGMNGRTDLYDIFYKPTANGQSLVDMNPKLGEQVETAKYRAQQLHDHYMTLDNFSSNQDAIADLQHDLATNPESITDERLQSMRTTYGPLGRLGGRPDLYLSIVAQRDAAVQTVRDTAAISGDINAGNGWKYKDELVQKHLSAMLGPNIKLLTDSLDNPNAFLPDGKGGADTAASVALSSIVTAMGRTGTNVVPYELTNLGGSVKLMQPDLKDKEAKVPTRFTNLHNLYKALKAGSNSGMVDQVFDADSKQIMESYDNLVTGNHVEEATAWRKAFYYQSPEGLEYMKKKVDSPDGQKLIMGAIYGALSGWGGPDSSRLPNPLRTDGSHWWSLGNGSYPKNYDSLMVPATIEMRRFFMANEWASGEDGQKHLDKWAQSNFVHDETTNRVLQVQPGTGSSQTAAAFTDFSNDLQKLYAPDVQVSYLYRGNGHYSVEMVSKEGKLLRRQYPDVTQQEIMDAHKFKNEFTPEESKVYNALDTKARDGKLTLLDLEDNRAVLDRARRIDALSGPLAKTIRKLQEQHVRERGILVTEVEKQGITSAPQWSPSASRSPDMASRNAVVSQFLKMGDVGGALTAAGEGVTTRVYKDTGGHQTIGVGYNLDANRATAPEDFRKAGIAFSVEDVTSGKASITTEQAIRLHQVVKPRYEAVARTAFDNHHQRGAYDSLSAPEKAVLTDMAYQAGGSVAQFKNLFNHMLTKDQSHLVSDLAMKITKGGTKVVDENRRTLRLNMLLGRFDSSMRHAGIIQ